jgi:hypothetical protein
MKVTRHFELIDESKIDGTTLYRIRCTRAIKNVKVGDIGGWIEKPENLCDSAWVCDDARVFGNIKVRDRIWISGATEVGENIEMVGSAKVHSYAECMVLYHQNNKV